MQGDTQLDHISSLVTELQYLSAFLKELSGSLYVVC